MTKCFIVILFDVVSFTACESVPVNNRRSCSATNMQQCIGMNCCWQSGGSPSCYNPCKTNSRNPSVVVIFQPFLVITNLLHCMCRSFEYNVNKVGINNTSKCVAQCDGKSFVEPVGELFNIARVLYWILRFSRALSSVIMYFVTRMEWILLQPKADTLASPACWSETCLVRFL